ncbi:hypothetical protein [Pseudomonas sp. NPDC090208]|uniref:hypothetical protein n=1 Tax=Pseudomonas sp. NPDC090208 TaxID=3364478 RepID=UPI0038143349
MRITIDPNKPVVRDDTGWRPGQSDDFVPMPTFAEQVARAKANGTFDPKATAEYLRNQVAGARTHVGFDEDWARAVLSHANELDPPTKTE